MPYIVNREEFLSRLQSTQPGIVKQGDQREGGDGLFIFQKGRVMTCSNEVVCIGKSGLGKEFIGAVEARGLLDILSKMPEEEIKVDSDGKKLMIAGAGRWADFTLESDVTMDISDVEKPETWKPLHVNFTEALKMVLVCAGTDDSKFVLTCVHMTGRFIEACDNAQAIRYKLKTKLEEDILVKRTSLKHIEPLGMTEYSVTDSWLHFRNPNNLVTSCRLYTDKYPCLDDVLVVDGEPTNLPAGLSEAMERAEVASKQNPDDNKVTISLRDGKIKVTGEGTGMRYREKRSIKYRGKPLEFMVAPSLMGELAKQHGKCEISAERVKVDGGKYVYVAMLKKKVQTPKKEESDKV